MNLNLIKAYPRPTLAKSNPLFSRIDDPSLIGSLSCTLAKSVLNSSTDASCGCSDKTMVWAKAIETNANTMIKDLILRVI